MKLLLDHCVDRRLADSIEGHEVATVAEHGLEQLKNGELLAAAAGLGYAALITTDRNLRYQQNLDRLPLTVIELNSPDARLQSLQSLVPTLLVVLGDATAWRFVSVKHDGEVERLSKRSD